MALSHELTLGGDLLDQLMPMHLLVDGDGIIQRAGPTLLRMRADLVGQSFLSVFNLRRPRGAMAFDALLEADQMPVHVAFHDPPQTALKGQIVTLGDGRGGLINLSFGISVVEAVATYRLTVGDFAVTDLAVEMLYLVEANSAVVEELRRLNERLQGAKNAAEQRASTDTLTGLKNRRVLDEVLARLATEHRPFALMHLDLDYFKTVNDSFGHAAGDHVLQVVAEILKSETRGQDTVARFGGDEFVLVFDGLVERGVLERIALRIINRLEAPIPFGDKLCRISASIGIAVSVQYTSPDPDVMLHDADMALYHSKRLGRARASFADVGGVEHTPIATVV